MDACAGVCDPSGAQAVGGRGARPRRECAFTARSTRAPVPAAIRPRDLRAGACGTGGRTSASALDLGEMPSRQLGAGRVGTPSMVVLQGGGGGAGGHLAGDCGSDAPTYVLLPSGWVSGFGTGDARRSTRSGHELHQRSARRTHDVLSCAMGAATASLQPQHTCYALAVHLLRRCSTCTPAADMGWSVDDAKGQKAREAGRRTRQSFGAEGAAYRRMIARRPSQAAASIQALARTGIEGRRARVPSSVARAQAAAQDAALLVSTAAGEEAGAYNAGDAAAAGRGTDVDVAAVMGIEVEDGKAPNNASSLGPASGW
ncbi:hypothetical protein C8J57DRAFT_1673849 [Mycena rebaudengoi]|nr:hypothetical protein C8J57DRAFT_1673849 [Mycena rebaudengoi]